MATNTSNQLDTVTNTNNSRSQVSSLVAATNKYRLSHFNHQDNSTKSNTVESNIQNQQATASFSPDMLLLPTDFSSAPNTGIDCGSQSRALVTMHPDGLANGPDIPANYAPSRLSRTEDGVPVAVPAEGLVISPATSTRTSPRSPRRGDVDFKKHHDNNSMRGKGKDLIKKFMKKSLKEKRDGTNSKHRSILPHT